ncbi:2-epi-5-epi-valiolone synthase [Lentzea aerocolonigenes]|uniref:2-epi-5-epi-valiolone synthase n=1 Tax=Lentzea aerocolonigenes TaxID=68170 RepID=A0A0F0HDJ5_LENAE|nr:sedoheptulose 7-phosphate cyclase [Lentzea aerocolonigenes]KJK51718.1 2-epi-5-epi-valiolone synthase [Lentzea aerocolonigenes]
MKLGDWTVRAVREVSYRVTEVVDLLAPGNDALAEAARCSPGSRRLVLVDENVLSLRGEEIRAYFTDRRVVPVVVGVPGGEATKTLRWVEKIGLAADSAGLDRRDPIVAVGGGVLTDVAGLAASLYRRGTPYVRVPTTLIGQVDAAVGAKTGINLHGGKNRLGSYHPADHTLLDRGFLATLPQRHVANGLAEIVKMAVIRDAVLFGLLDAEVEDLARIRLSGETGQRVMHRAITGMLAELEVNLWEHDLRRVVDFGHTISPAVEMAADPVLLHGEAVSIDMALSCVLAAGRGLLGHADTARVLTLLRRAGLPVWNPVCDLGFLWSAVEDSVRHRGGRQSIPLPSGIGTCVFVDDVTEDELRVCVSELHRLAGTEAGIPA